MAKKITSLLLVLLMALSLAACSTGAPAEAPATDAPAAEAPADGTDAPAADGGAESAYADKLTISMSMLDAEKSGVSAKDQWLCEKFNFEWDLIPVTWGDWNEKVRAWIAGDDLPDILWWDMKAGNTSEFRMWAEAGAFREIPQDMSAWPELEALLERAWSDEKFLTVNGKLYGWPCLRANPEWYDDACFNQFVYRRDWAKAVGMYKEGDMYTWDEVKAMIKAVQEQDPGNLGAGQTIGIVSETWAFPGVFLELSGWQQKRYGYQINEETGLYEYYAATDGYLNELKHVTELYQDGYIWKDQVVDSGSDGMNNFYGGKAFMALTGAGPTWLTGTAWPKMVETGIVDSRDDVAPMIVLSPADNETFYLIQTEDLWTVAHFRHDLEDEKMNRILDIWNWLASEEGRIFRVAGIEGVDYTKNDDGTYNILWEKNADGQYINPYADYSYNIYQPAGSLATPNETSDPAGYEAYENFFEMMRSPAYKAQLKDWESEAFGGELYSTLGPDINTKFSEKTTEIVVGGGDVEAQWTAFVESMMPDVQAVLDELNAGLLGK